MVAIYILDILLLFFKRSTLKKQKTIKHPVYRLLVQIVTLSTEKEGFTSCVLKRNPEQA
jgi:hypothetical protein